MQLWTRPDGWEIDAASDSLLTKLGIELPATIQLQADRNGDYTLGPSAGLPKVSGTLSPAGTTEAIYFPASLRAYDPKNTAVDYLKYVLIPNHKTKLAQGDPIRLEGMIIGADQQSHFLTFYQVLRGNDPRDYFVAVLQDPGTNGNGAGVGHTK